MSRGEEGNIHVILSQDDVLLLMEALASAMDALREASKCHEREGRLVIARKARDALNGFELLHARLQQAIVASKTHN